MIGRCFSDSQHGRPIVILPMLVVLFSGTQTTNKETTQIRDVDPKHDLGKATNLHCTVFLTATLYYEYIKKRMREIWQKCASFQTTSQRLMDQIRTIIKKDWFSGLEIPEIPEKTYYEQDTNTVSDTLSFVKQEQSNQNKPATSENKKCYTNTT